MQSSHEALERIRGGPVVSCQAYPGEPMRSTQVMAAVAEAVVLGGAVGVRAQGLDDLVEMRKRLEVPLIGLVKTTDESVYITPTVALSRALVDVGSDIVAMDGTRRERPDGQQLWASVSAVHEAGALVMADCGSVADAVHSVESGADCVGTTLAGYTGEREVTHGPDLELLRELVDAVAVPVIAEGRIRTPAEAAACLQAGAYAVVVGTAITHPTSITKTFAAALPLS